MLELALLIACVVLIVVERRGVRTTLQLSFKERVKRSTCFLAQWGQGTATLIIATVIWQLDPEHRRAALGLVATLALASLCSLIIKRLVGRVRPNRPMAGQFLGASLRHNSKRESFPSSHSACATAVSVYLALLYPPVALVFIALGTATSLLRYVLDAHWPSDVIAGIALGYVCASYTMQIVGGGS